MTGKALKEFVARIPDDAQVVIAGHDSGGYDWTAWPYAALVENYQEDPELWLLIGDEDNGV